MAHDYEIETIKRIYTNGTGEYIHIGPDAEGLDLLDIRQYDDTGKCTARITMSKEQAKLVKQALDELGI
ncbi:MAG: hypothetical protein FP815_09855 [Desulfobulbaceae bacterium]|nr:hypothetical protein [Desulfobulbaceae bacterium]